MVADVSRFEHEQTRDPGRQGHDRGGQGTWRELIAQQALKEALLRSLEQKRTRVFTEELPVRGAVECTARFGSAFKQVFENGFVELYLRDLAEVEDPVVHKVRLPYKVAASTCRWIQLHRPPRPRRAL